jgi:hypothetical protein
VWSGPDATGTQLATLDLPVTGANCGGSVRDYTCWAPASVSFTGDAMSVDFSGAAEKAAFDNITIGSQQAVPDPATVLLVLAGIGGGSAYRKRQRRLSA